MKIVLILVVAATVALVSWRLARAADTQVHRINQP
ncbi:hypothetical protein HNR30_001466 [Nonomuraea soli]|uniref:Uncharacterized protein n=1 Tax=Nonomuraea soli TaxID=1032476 RepID=A0A7W0CFG3_9ACTN|nr:hypothetical protein [Nonomuraea soli]